MKPDRREIYLFCLSILQKARSTILCTIAPLIVLPTLSAAESPLAKPERLSAYFEPTIERAVLQWKSVPHASSYLVKVEDGEGNALLNRRTNRTRLKIGTALLSAGIRYRVKVKAVSGSKQSSFSRTNYTHVLSRSPGKGALLTENSAERTGSYYLPSSYKKGPKPVLIGFHGSGGTGRTIVNAFAKLANEYQFIIVAPSSRLSPEGVATWEIGELPGEKSEDFFHAINCLDELQTFEGVTIDESNILSLGYSAGGTFAAYFATNGETAHHFATLHNALYIAGLGPRTMRAWLSTGTSDPLSPPEEIRTSVTGLQMLGFEDISFETFPTDHSLIQKELRAVIEWWLQE